MIYVWGVPVVSSVADIIDVLRATIRAQNVDLLKDVQPMHGNVMVTCINHGAGVEKKPSLGILTEDTIRNGKLYKAGTCNCFTCGFTVDLPEFVSRCFGYNDAGQFGYKWITENFVNLSIEKREPLTLNMDRDKKVETVPYISDEVLDTYRFTHPYMYERKLTDKIIDYFDIGWDREKDALTFPVHDLNGKVVLIQRRKIGFKMFINDEGADRGSYIYGLYQVYQNLHWIKEVIVCESPIDALTCWRHRRAGVSTMGANITKEQVRLLKALPVRHLISGYDNPEIDKAGREGNQKLVRNLSDTKLLSRILFPQDVKDINEMTDEQFLSASTTLLI